MSHDTHNHHDTQNDKPVIAFKSAFYFVIMIAGLFIATIGFVKSMSHDEGGHDAHGAAHSEAAHGTHEEHATEATQQELHGEKAEHHEEAEHGAHH